MTTSISKAYRKAMRLLSTPTLDRFVDETAWPRFQYNKQKRGVNITIQPGMSITFTDKLARILGTGEMISSLYSDTLILKGNQVTDIEGGLHELYVYCDLLECVPVGDTVAPLLRIVEADGPRGEMINIQYDHPRYVPLQKKAFDSIEIDKGRHWRTYTI
jgi:hypothetical protein